MLDAIAVVVGVALAAALGWFAVRRDDVLRYHDTDTSANRVGRRWLWSRHGSR